MKDNTLAYAFLSRLWLGPLVCPLPAWINVPPLNSIFHRIKNMASANKEVRFVGIDQAVQVLEETQPNVEFQRHDVNSGLEPYHGSFDLVHVRCIGSGISSYRSLLEEATRCLKPGGLAIFVEGDFDLLKEDQRTIQEPASDENPNGSWLQKWMQGTFGRLYCKAPNQHFK